MPAFQSLAIELRGHYHKPFASIPSDIQQRILKDFAPWPWATLAPRERCQRAKQWDYENDPVYRESREGIEAVTNPTSSSYSLEATQRLRGDFLPTPSEIQAVVTLPPIDFSPPPQMAPSSASGNHTGAKLAAKPTVNNVRITSPPKRLRQDLLSPLIAKAQAACGDPLNTASVWSKLRDMASSGMTPLKGATAEGLQWINERDEPQFFSYKNLGDRLGREKLKLMARAKTR